MDRSEDEAGKAPTIPSGYFSSKCLKDLVEKLVKASGQWKDLGLQLGLEPGFLQNLDPTLTHDQQVQHFREMLEHWLRNPPEYPNTRWILLQAVKEVDKGFALKLKKDYDNKKELKIDDLHVLLNDLYELVPKWRHLGRALKVDECQLDIVSAPEDNKEKLIQVLQAWMQQKADEATLHSLYFALKSKPVGHADLANEIIKDEALIDLLTPQDEETDFDQPTGQRIPPKGSS